MELSKRLERIEKKARERFPAKKPAIVYKAYFIGDEQQVRECPDRFRTEAQAAREKNVVGRWSPPGEDLGLGKQCSEDEQEEEVNDAEKLL